MLYLWLSKDRKVNTNKAFSLLAEEGWGMQKLLVPEQFSHQTQKAFCAYAGDRASRLAQVLDFTHLAQRVFCKEGGIAQTQTDSVGQLLMMALAVEQVRSRLKIYGVGADKPEFLLQLLDMFEEFRSFCITPGALKKAAGELEGSLAQKTEEFVILMESYEAVCENCGQNPLSRLNRLSEALEESDFGTGERFLFDGFTDFNGIQLEIIGQLLGRAAEVHIFLACDSPEHGAQQFAAARDTVKALKNLCRGLEIEVKTQTLPQAAEENALTYLRSLLFVGGGSVYAQKQEEIAFLKGRDSLELCRTAAGEILRLVSQGVRWRDITLACPDFKSFGPLLASVFRRADIPAYFAGDTDILRQSVVQMLLSALQAATGYMEQEAVLSYLKSGYCPIERESCDRLENYILLWNIKASRFEQPWTMHPRGLDVSMEPEDEKTLARLNAERKTAIEPLLRLRRELKNASNTGQMVLSFYRFMEEIALEATLRRRAEECQAEGRLQKVQEYVQLYSILSELLEQMYGVLGSSERSPEDFAALFRAALSCCSVGTIPSYLDCVNVGSLMSQHRSDTPYLFLLGANEGSFPSGQSADSLLTDPERSMLMAVGLSVSPTAAGRLERELAAMDSVLSAPEKRLYLGTVIGLEAYYARRAERLFPEAPILSREEELICRSRREYLDYLTERGEEEGEIPILSRQAEELRKAKEYLPQALEEEGVQALYGKTLRLSSSKVDALATCRFAYFLNYGLKAKERKPAQVDPSVYGNFVHDVLEHTTRQVQQEGGFHKVSLERVLAIAGEQMERYTKEKLSDLWQSERAEFLFRRNFAEVEMTVRELYRELSQSAFEPRWFELNFSDREGNLPAVKILGEKMTALLEGKIDRTDLWQDGDKLYVRVVDYKTGKKKFEYSKILHGLGLQMLLYLFALVKGGQSLAGRELIPAGVLYFPARMDSLSIDDRENLPKVEQKRRESLKRSGLVLLEEPVLQAMEPYEEKPLYLPYKLEKDGTPGEGLADRKQMKLMADFVFQKVGQLGDMLYSGNIDPNPYLADGRECCAWCPYGQVCREHKQLRILPGVKSEEFWKTLEEVEDCG